MAKLENIQSVKKKSVDKPIHFVPNGKDFTDIDKMKKTFKPTEIVDEKGLLKQLEKGNHVYCYIDPFEAEMSAISENEVIRICWYTTREQAMDMYYERKDSI